MIPVNAPVVSLESKQNVIDALETGWVSSVGKYVTQFEEQFAQYLDVKYATTVSNGTAALHLAMAALDLGPGDEIIIPDLTIVSCGLAALYVGATPVFVDVDPQTGNLDPESFERAITEKTKAVMVVHLYGHPAAMDPILEIARRHNLAIIEDAAEAHGATYKGKKAGSFGDVACFSFYGNKIITTGEGGMVVSNRQDVIEKARLLKDLAHVPGKRFYHEEIGFNYRMTNLQAAMGVGELSHIEEYVEKKREMARTYTQLLSDIPDLILPSEHEEVRCVYWMYSVVLKDTARVSREEVMTQLKNKGVDTRTYFYPLSSLPVFAGRSRAASLNPVSQKLSQQGFYLPSGLALATDEMKAVSQALHEVFQS